MVLKRGGDLVNKKSNILLFLIFSIFALILFSCSNKQIKYSDVAYFAEPVIQDLCLAFENEDFKDFSYYFINYFSTNVQPENLEKLFINISQKIGKYIPQSLSYSSIKKVKNKYIISYTANFTNEQEPVIITLNFEKINDNFKLNGFSLDSPKLRDK